MVDYASQQSFKPGQMFHFSTSSKKILDAKLNWISVLFLLLLKITKKNVVGAVSQQRMPMWCNNFLQKSLKTNFETQMMLFTKAVHKEIRTLSEPIRILRKRGPRCWEGWKYQEGDCSGHSSALSRRICFSERRLSVCLTCPLKYMEF